MTTAADGYKYDVCLSFAGEQRTYVEQVADALRRRNIRVFYDAYEQVNLWGKDLYEHLDFVYQKSARYCVVFASADYAAKAWTGHERQSAQARAIETKGEYLLPARFDETAIPGLRETIAYIDLRTVGPDDLAGMIEIKVGRRPRTFYVPDNPDRLFKDLKIRRKKERELASQVARWILNALWRMDLAERRALVAVLINGCTRKLPENVHAPLDIVRRELKTTSAEAVSLLRGLVTFGISVNVKDNADGHPDIPILVLRWNFPANELGDPGNQFIRATEICYKMFRITAPFGGCWVCDPERLTFLDFSGLSSTEVPNPTC